MPSSSFSSISGSLLSPTLDSSNNRTTACFRLMGTFIATNLRAKTRNTPFHHSRRRGSFQEIETRTLLGESPHWPHTDHSELSNTRTTTTQDHLHPGAAGRIGIGVREIPLSRHILQRGISEEHQIERGQNPGMVPEQKSEIPEAGETIAKSSDADTGLSRCHDAEHLSRCWKRISALRSSPQQYKRHQSLSSDGSHVLFEYAATIFNVALGVEYVSGNGNATRHNGNVSGGRMVQQKYLGVEDEHGSSSEPRCADVAVPDIILKFVRVHG